MNRLLKALAAIMLMTTVLFVVGCKPAATGSIYGVVTDYATNESVSGASVQLRPTGETTVTGTDGMYEFLDVEAGSYSITVTKNEYSDLVDDYVIELKEGKRMRRDAQIAKALSFLHILNSQNVDITEIDFGSVNEQKSFDLCNKGTKKYNYVISKTANWLSVDKPEGTIGIDEKKTIMITIDRSKLPLESNTTNLIITAEGVGSTELTVKAQKSGDYPVVNILGVTTMSPTSSRIKCEVTSAGGQSVTERGICFNTFGSPTIKDQVIKDDGNGLGQYFIDMSDLDSSKTYHVCAYAKNATGTGYSRELVFKPGAGDINLPKVTTLEVTDITQTSAKGGGNVTDEGSSPVTERGICWSTSHLPTTSDNHGHSGTGLGTYTVNMTGLTANTTYYVRAYASNKEGTTYGDEVSFNFSLNTTYPTVTTKEVTDITKTSAKCGGKVESAGGTPVTERGVCWSTHSNPTISDDHLNSGAGGTGNYFVTIDDLTPDTYYFVRAYATNSSGTAYGNEVSFSTLGETVRPEGSINGIFSISDNQQVWFSQGNLQYIGSATPAIWKFAENQWDYLGTSTGQNSDATNVDRDLFGWATSGWYSGTSGTNYYMPYDVNTNSSYYGPGYSNNLTGQYAEADWGVYNAISNGGNEAGMWRTLSQTEWDYVLSKRNTPSRIRFAKAVVNNVNGVIVLPDDWVSQNYVLASINNASASYNSNTVSAGDWTSILEPKGAVFLPASGMRRGTNIENLGENGLYWSTTYGSSGQAQGVNMTNSSLVFAPGYTSEKARSNGGCVRLVYELR